MAKINRKNRKGQRHGLWRIGIFFREVHYINGVSNGYSESVIIKNNFKNGKPFGILFYYTFYLKQQYFHKQGQKFAEQLEWRK